MENWRKFKLSSGTLLICSTGQYYYFVKAKKVELDKAAVHKDYDSQQITQLKGQQSWLTRVLFQ